MASRISGNFLSNIFQQLVHINVKENRKDPHYLPFVRGIYQLPGSGFPYRGIGNVESFPFIAALNMCLLSLSHFADFLSQHTICRMIIVYQNIDINKQTHRSNQLTLCESFESVQYTPLHIDAEGGR